MKVFTACPLLAYATVADCLTLIFIMKQPVK
jgi:hypothetical protein